MPKEDIAMRRSHLSRLSLCAAAVGALAIAAFAVAPSRAAEDAVVIPPPAADVPPAEGLQTAVVAGGCFWGVQGVFQHVEGVTSAVSGYAGGAANTAHYDMVATNTTAHAEAVQVTFDPRRVSYGHILQIYFSVAHDPTELNRQGPDVGTQYRSAIFPANPEQTQIAEAYVAQLNQAHVFDAPIVTKIEPGRDFYPAESYHQDFLTRNPRYPYIVINDLPKIENLKRLFPDLFTATPVLVAAARS